MTISRPLLSLAGCISLATSLVLPLAHAGTGSAHLWYPTPNSDIIMATVNVLTTNQHTYYESLGWNVGAEAGGYTGIQTHNDGLPVYIFSIWDPIAVKNVPIKAIYAKPDSIVENFGGEGTGLHYLDKTTGWKVGSPVTSLIRRWPVADHTYFGLWTLDASTAKWTHHTTFDFPVANVPFYSGGTNSFIENWSGQSLEVTRTAEYYNVWARELGKGWKAMQTAYPTAGKPVLEAKQHGLNAEGSRFVLQQGVDYTQGFSDPLKLTKLTTLTAPDAKPTQISTMTTSFDAATKAVKVDWSLDATGAPQFAYQVSLTDASTGLLLAAINRTIPQERSVTVTLPGTVPATIQVKLTITDVFDRSDVTKTSSLTTTVTPTPSPKPIITPTPLPTPTVTLPIGVNLKLQSLSSGLSLAIEKDSKTAAAPLVQNWISGTLGWKLETTSVANEYVLRSTVTGQCADIEYGSTSNGARLIQYPCHYGPNQRFKVKADTATNSYTLQGVKSGLCVDVPGSSKTLNTRLIQWTCHGGANQKWRLVK